MGKLFYLRNDNKKDPWMLDFEQTSSYIDEVICFESTDFSIFKNKINGDDSFLIADVKVILDESINLHGIHEKLILALDSREQKYKEEIFNLKDTSYLGIIDTSLESELYLSFFNTIFSWRPFKEKELFLKHVNKILDKIPVELERIKSIHDKVVPFRREILKGLTLSSKFAAGLSNGGEFFDVAKGEEQALLVLTNSKTYVISSIVLGHVESLRNHTHFTDEIMQKFISELSSDLSGLDLIGRENPENIELLIATIDLKKMEVSGYLFGDIGMISSKGRNIFGNNFLVGDIFLEKAHFNYRLKRQEQILILSPGFNTNARAIDKGLITPSNLIEQFNLGPKDLLNEFFFKFKSFCNAEFLEYDATALFLEVDKHVILQV